jgi:hypothetical protein
MFHGMDKKLEEAVFMEANQAMKGAPDKPGAFIARDMLTGAQVTRLEEAVGHTPLKLSEMNDAAVLYQEVLRHMGAEPER